jgi:catechol 2,3-dioxygenase-like lactoylglutathione lyase family enzyme
MSDEATALGPKSHHVNLKTTRLQEMIDWYARVVGAEVVFRDDTGAFEQMHRRAMDGELAAAARPVEIPAGG